MQEKKGLFVPQGYLFHNVFEKIINIGNISNLPASISRLSTSLDKSLRLEKWLVGPTQFNPGPTLLRHIATAVNDDVKSMFCKPMISNELQKIMKYKTIYVWILLIIEAWGEGTNCSRVLNNKQSYFHQWPWHPLFSFWW